MLHLARDDKESFFPLHGETRLSSRQCTSQYPLKSINGFSKFVYELVAGILLGGNQNVYEQS